ncbi:Protein EARLY FLOWERING [Castilleja foliolosa]|uniref:Protein EARLY FLOWERING n=1 Tax=Castilleja foliolosa TaxID=1961234 RepID=A0ABD3CVM2_9LAMI
MKRVNDEKIMGPMFPRLHVNDTDKGGPKAPPRNKMALYEQLSIPSNRLTHAAASSVQPSSQGVGNEKGIFFSSQPPTRSQPEKQYTHQYSDLSTPLLAQSEGRKNPEEDEYTVPIFVHPVRNQECDEFNFNHRSKCQKSEKTGTFESKIRKEENSERITINRINPPVSNFSSTVEKPSEICGEYKPGNKRCNTTSVLEENVALEKRNDPNLAKALPSEEGPKILHDNSNKTGFRARLGRPQQKTLDRIDSLSETSVVDTISGLDITPDDVVGIIGQKHFWKARREIVNQQRIFAVQVFELHRLIKVQKLIAASPHILHEDSAFFTTPIKALPGKRKSLNFPVKEIPNVPKQKTEPEKQIHKNISPPENTTSKASVSAVQTGIPPPSYRPVSGNSRAQSVCSDYTPGSWGGFNPPPAPIGNQWLIPVMSPSEGLIYKPYPGPGFMGPACGSPGPNQMMGHFPTPAYGNPAPHHQYQPPSFPRAGPHGYFPPYGMPVTNIASFSGSSTKQTNLPPFPNQNLTEDTNLAAIPGRKNRASKLDNLNVSEDIETQDSIASSPVERLQDNRKSRSLKERNVLPLFPTSPPVDGPKSSRQPPEPESRAQVIKVVPHHAKSASESAARIFLSLQEGRKQYDLA